MVAKIEGGNLTPAAARSVLHEGTRYYDVMAWPTVLGRERAFRERVIDLSRLNSRDSVNARRGGAHG